MRFLICRESEGAVSKKPPCIRAIRGPEAPAWPGEYEWFVELESITELMTLLEETGGGVGVFSAEPGEQYPVIQIFDEDESEDEED